MELSERRGLRLFTLSALFFAQGIPWGFLGITLPGYLAGHGVQAGALGLLTAMSYWPYALKWVWGPAIDGFTIARFGRRRPWIVVAQAMMALSAAALFAVRDVVASFDLLVALVLINTLFSAIQNVAVDGLAIDVLAPDERGRASGLMYGAKWAGGIVGGAGLGTVIEYAGFDAALAIQAIALAAIVALPVLIHERSGAAPERPKQVGAMLLRVLRLRSPILGAIIMLVSSIATGLLMVIGPVLLMQHLQWQQDEYSQIAGGLALAMGFAGSVVAGMIADRIGPKRLVAIAALATSLAWTAFACGDAYWHSHVFIYVFALFEPFAQAVMIVSLWSVCMSVSHKTTAATQFSAYTALNSVSVIIGSQWLAGTFRAWLDFRGVYFAAAIIQLAVIAVLPFIDPEQVRRELPTS